MQLAPQPSSSVFRVGSGAQNEGPVFFWRPYSNLPARHVLDSLTDGDTQARPRHARALFMGCTDPRTIIKSLAVLQPGKGSQQLHLTAVMNDVHVPTLARTALLLLMAAELDPDSKADMQLLFDVWFNTIWSSNTWTRFAAFTQRLSDGSVPWLMPATRQDQQQLQEVWRWWLDEKHPNRPTPAALHKKRSAFKKSNPVSAHSLYKQPNHFFHIPSDKYPAGFRNAVKVLHPTTVDMTLRDLADHRTLRVNFESTAPKPPHVEQARLAMCAVLEGVKQHLETGSLSWDGNRKELQDHTYNPQVNITFVEPGTGAWNVHPDQQPFTCWGTYTAEEVTTAMQRGLPPASALADVFITRMASFVGQFQTTTAFQCFDSSSSGGSSTQKPVALQVQLVCGEGLGLCLNQLQHRPTASTLAEDSACGSRSNAAPGNHEAAPFPTFDIIDTGSLCDDVGLLPLLVAVTPRLQNHPAARLHTVPATWTLAAPRMDYYLQEQALGMPLTMTPTLLGLRLVTDINWGRPSALRNLVVEAAVFDPRELAWAPVPPSQPQPRLQLPDLTTPGTDQYAYKDVQWGPPGSIGAVLRSVCKLCCTNNHHAHPHKYADVAIKLPSPQTFAWLLAACIPRLDLSSLLPAQSQPSSTNAEHHELRNAAAAHSTLWALRTRVSALLPPHFRLAFQGAIDAVRASLQAATGSAAAAAGVPACNHQSFLMLPISEVQHGELAVAGGVRLRRPYVRALLGTRDDTGHFTFHAERNVRQRANPLSHAMAWYHLEGLHCDHVYEFAYEGSPLDPPPQKWATISKFVKSIKPTNDRLRVHILDCCSVPYSKTSGWRAAFMVPSDHASMQLPDETSMLVSVGPDYFGPTHRPQKHKIMDVPMQAVSPVLAQCFLHPLLCTPLTRAATQCSHESTSLQVVQLDETVWGYEVVLKLQGPGTPSGLSIALPQAATAKPPPSYTGSGMPCAFNCPSSHVVELHLVQPMGVSTQVVLGWPVAAGFDEPEGAVDDSYSSGCGVNAKLKKSEKLVELTLAKAQVWERWPEDGVPPPFRCKPLPAHLQEQTMAYTLQFMYTGAGPLPDVPERSMGALLSSERFPQNALRSFTMQVLMYSAGRPFTTFLMFDSNSKGASAAEHSSLYILVDNEWQVDVEDGYRVVMPAMVVDLKLMLGFFNRKYLGFNHDKYMRSDMDKVVAACKRHGPDYRTTFAAGRHELAVLRRYLWHNAQRWQPNEWQQQLLSHAKAPAGPAGPYVLPCYATCITPVFTEHAQQFDHSDQVFEELFPAGIPPLGEPLPYPLPAPAVAEVPLPAWARSDTQSSGGRKAGDQLADSAPKLAATAKVAGQPRKKSPVGGESTHAMAWTQKGIPHTGGMAVPIQQLVPTNVKTGIGCHASFNSSGSSTGREGRSSTGVSKGGKKGEAAATPRDATAMSRAACASGSSGALHDHNAHITTSMGNEAWMCQKMSELRVNFSHCTDEELRSMAEMAYSMHAGSANA